MVYLITSFISSLFSITNQNKKIQNFNYLNVIFLIYLIVIIGLRFEVGGDWNSYKYIYFRNLEYFDIKNIFFTRDPFFKLLNYLSQFIFLDYFGVNLITAIIVIFCIHKFSLNMPDYWLSIHITIPVILFLMTMSFNKQAIALSIALLGFINLNKNNYLNSFFYFTLSTMFHFSAVFNFLIFFIYLIKKYPLSFLIIILFFLIIINFNFYNYYWHYINEYIIRQRYSGGAQIRIILNLIPSIIITYLVLFNNYKEKIPLYILIMSLLTFIVFITSFTFSTAMDRINFYLIPLQLFTYGYLISNINLQFSIILKYLVLLIYIVYFPLFLIFSTHGGNWIPYKNLIVCNYSSLNKLYINKLNYLCE